MKDKEKEIKKSELSERLKLLIDHYKLTQGKLALLINSYPSQLSQVMSGSNPGYELVLRILQAFPDVSSDWLMMGKGQMLRQKQSNVQKAAPAPTIITSTVDIQGNEIPVFVGLTAQAGYLSGYSDPEYLSQLPGVRIPFFQAHDVRAFEVKGDSMEPTFYERDIVFTNRIYDLNEIKNGRVYIVVSKNDGIVLKRVVRNKGDKHLSLISDNRFYQAYTIPEEEVMELWYFRRRFTAQVPPPSDVYERLGDMERELNDLRKYLGEAGQA
ncbi:MAG: S24 family peptidase [Bacteroidota bacterium]|nr:S24 family peptidase [Bacteroidota bacterium]